MDSTFTEKAKHGAKKAQATYQKKGFKLLYSTKNNEWVSTHPGKKIIATFKNEEITNQTFSEEKRYEKAIFKIVLKLGEENRLGTMKDTMTSLIEWYNSMTPSNKARFKEMVGVVLLVGAYISNEGSLEAGIKALEADAELEKQGIKPLPEEETTKKNNLFP